MSTPDLTPERAAELRQHTALPSRLVPIGLSALGFLAAAGWLARLLEARFFIPVLATGFIAFGIAYACLAVAKPALYWNSESVIRARLKSSATTVTTVNLAFAIALVALGALGILW